jgi:uncharacterized protein YbjT (DUF2867 family)
MILLTGGTGFIGRVLTRQLVESGHRVRLLLRPSLRTPRLPTSVPVEVAVTGLDDTQGLRAAMRGIDTIYHLAGEEGEGGRSNLQVVDIDGTRALCQAASDARVRHLLYLSHLGASRAAGFPVLKAKGIAEEYIRKSGFSHTILRGSLLFGPGDEFTTGLAMLLAAAPGFLPLPSRGETLLQPLWVEDLVTCLLWSLDNPDTVNQTFDLGGSETFALRQVVEIIMEAAGLHRMLVNWPTQSMRSMTIIMESIFPRFPASIFWLDYLAVNRTCPVETITRIFGLMPSRFASRLDYLRNEPWTRNLLRRLFTRYG